MRIVIRLIERGLSKGEATLKEPTQLSPRCSLFPRDVGRQIDVHEERKQEANVVETVMREIGKIFRPSGF